VGGGRWLDAGDNSCALTQHKTARGPYTSLGVRWRVGTRIATEVLEWLLSETQKQGARPQPESCRIIPTHADALHLVHLARSQVQVTSHIYRHFMCQEADAERR
jgi:hypothetical protein